MRVSLTTSLSSSSLTNQLNQSQAKTLVAPMFCIWQMFLSAGHHKCAHFRALLGNKSTTEGDDPLKIIYAKHTHQTSYSTCCCYFLWRWVLHSPYNPEHSWVQVSVPPLWKAVCKPCWGGAPDIKTLQLENGDSCWAGVTCLRWVSRSNVSTFCSSYLNMF